MDRILIVYATWTGATRTVAEAIGAVLDDTEEFNRLFFLLKSIVRATAQDAEDGRDWEAIRTWAKGLRPALLRS